MKLHESQQLLLQAMKHALRSETFVPQTDPMLVRELAVQHKVLPLVCEAIPTVPPVMKKQAMLYIKRCLLFYLILIKK